MELYPGITEEDLAIYRAEHWTKEQLANEQEDENARFHELLNRTIERERKLTALLNQAVALLKDEQWN